MIFFTLLLVMLKYEGKQNSFLSVHNGQVCFHENVLPEIAHSFCSVFLVKEELNIYYTEGQAECWPVE